ncbi:MAG: DnaJ family domain-containing protein [Pseudomonadota bacterium]
MFTQGRRFSAHNPVVLNDMISTGFEKIIEERILQAQRRGDFENLPGSGKPLEIEDDRHIPEDLRLAYKILKNAGCIPPEIELKKEIHQTRDLLAAMDDTAQKYRTLTRLNFMIQKLNCLRNIPVEREMPQLYAAKLALRMDPKPSS